MGALDPMCPRISRQELSKHRVYATFEGIRQGREPMMMIYPPMPAKQYAVFRVDEYIFYAKLGKYGDAKQDQFQFVPAEQPASVSSTVDALALGDKVLLEWQQDYVTKESCSGGKTKFPEGSVLQLFKIPKAPSSNTLVVL